MSSSAQSHPSRQPSAARPLAAGAALLALIVFTCLCPAAAAQDIKADGWKLEEILPEDTMLFLKCSGVEQLMADRPSLDLFRIWAEEEVQDFFAPAYKEIPKYLDAGQPPMFPFKKVWALFQGEVSLACSTHIVPFSEGAFCATALSVDMAGEKEKFLETLHSLLGMTADVPHLERGEIDYRGHKLNWIGMPRKRIIVCFTTIRNLFVATFGRHYMQAIIDCHLDGKVPLSEVPSFRRCRKNVGGNATRMMVYVNFAPFTGALAPFCPYEAVEYLDLLGLNGIDALCLASAVESGGSRDSLFIDAPGIKKGFLRAFSPHPVSPENARLAPADSVYFADVVFDPELILQEADSFISSHLPEFYGEFRKGLDQIRKETGIDLEKDILAPLGDEVSFAVSLPRGGMVAIPDMILTLKIDDVEKFRVLQDRIFAMVQNEVKVVKTDFNDRTMHRIVLPEPGIPFSPTMVVEEGRLIVAGTPITMKKYLKRIDSGKPGLDENEAFRNAMASVPTNASAVEFVDLSRGVGMLYSLGAPFLSNLFVQNDLPLDAAMLPMTETLTDNLSSAVAYSVINEDGILFSGRWCIGVSALASVAVTAVDHLVQNDLIQPLLSAGKGHTARKQKTRKWDSALNGAYGLMQAEQWEKAVKIFSFWIDANQEMSECLISARTDRGYCLLKLERYPEAIADYAFVAENSEKTRGLAYYNIACALSRTNKKEKALHYIDLALSWKFADLQLMASDSDLNNIRQDPRFHASLSLKKTGDALMNAGDFSKGEEFFSHWIVTNPEHGLVAWAYRNRGYCRLATGQNAASIPDYEKAAALDDSMKPIAYYNIACACSRLQKTDKAIHYFEKALVAGFNDFKLIRKDPDLDNIRKDPKFKALLEML